MGQKKRPIRPPGSQWAYILRYYHGMLPEQWHAMWAEQAGLCYLCERPLPDDRNQVAIDHDHSCCGEHRSCGFCRRGFAHKKCNSAIGMIDDDVALLRRIASNLERAQAITDALMLTKPEQGEMFTEEAS